MRILFLFLIQFYSLALAADRPVIREETAFGGILYAKEGDLYDEEGDVYDEEADLRIPVVCAIENEEEDESSKWYSEFITFPHSDYRDCCKRVVAIKFTKIIFRYILYLNIRI